ncbi:MAG: hypothetical protein ACP5NZ_01905 [Nanobdellota archaeon]
MALSKIFKKSDAPDELPDLAIDELRKELKKDYSEKEENKKEETLTNLENKKEEKEEIKHVEEEKVEEPPKEETPIPEEKIKEEEKTEETFVEPSVREIEKPKVKEENINVEKSFFSPLLAELRKENFDPSKINEWYQKKFSEKGAIEEMKEYWEKQKNTFITETIEKEFKQRISEKMNHLQMLESEWQEIYINLIKKEEEMKKEEKNIKKIIKDFSQLFVKKGNLKKERKSK